MPKETIIQRRGKYLDNAVNYVLGLEIDDKGEFSVSDVFTLNKSLALKTVRFYAQNLHTLKDIYGIEDKVEASKIAGLMANAILRFRPLVPIGGQDECEEIEDNDCNELLAIYHGISVCSAAYENGKDIMDTFMIDNEEWYNKWLKQFMFLLQEREYTSESLVMIFETLCLAVFSSNKSKIKPLPMPRL